MPDREEQRRVNAIRARLTQLAARWPQAEIARRLGTSRTNVSRYLKGTRMPLDVGGAIVEKLGVNPAWLLTGEGAPMLSDVSGATEKTAGDMLALVEAMNQVAQMRLGALTGKHHLRVLRELSDALDRYETLRSELIRQTSPVYAELLDHYQKALTKGQVEQADSLRKALFQVQRLCDDRALDRRFWGWQSYHEHFLGSPERAVELGRKVFREVVSESIVLDERRLFETCNFAASLDGAGRSREARAVCRAMLAIAQEMGLEGPGFHALECTLAAAGMSLGLLAESMGLFQRAFMSLAPKFRNRLFGMHIQNQLLAGLVGYFPSIHLWPGDVQSPEMLRFAIWLEDPKALEHACTTWIGAGVKEPPNTLVAGFAVAMRDVLAGERAGWRAFLDSRVEGQLSAGRADAGAFRLAVHAAQLARMAGDKSRASRQLARAGDILSQLPAEIAPPPLVLGSYWRSVLEVDARRRAQAQAFFLDWHARGYGCFAAFAES